LLVEFGFVFRVAHVPELPLVMHVVVPGAAGRKPVVEPAELLLHLEVVGVLVGRLLLFRCTHDLSFIVNSRLRILLLILLLI
jgi:hypothetical protein